MTDVQRRDDRRALKNLHARIDIMENDLGKVKVAGLLGAGALVTFLVVGIIMNKDTLYKRLPVSIRKILKLPNSDPAVPDGGLGPAFVR